MGIPTTTPIAIRAALITAIEGLTPTEVKYRAFKWRYVSEAEVAGPAIRTFTILHSIATETPDGIHGGDGIEYDYEMRIRVSYGSLSGDDLDAVTWQDGRDLWLLVHPLPDGGAGSIAGLLAFRGPLRAEYAVSEAGYALVDFIVQTHFKASDS